MEFDATVDLDAMVDVIVVGGGAAGFFAAITAAELGSEVMLLEANPQVLAKVKISGGGRCNVTHSCFDPRELVKAYPRGGKALRGPFSRFQPADTIDWFAGRGVATKTEDDGRMFPTTDDSSTIVDCLQNAAKQAGVSVRTNCKVVEVQRGESSFLIHTATGDTRQCRQLLLATGGSRRGFELAERLGHTIVPPVPSLFTFQIRDPRLQGLQGVSVGDVHCELLASGKKFKQSGPLLVTHWGLSGPAVLKLSAWAARELHASRYQAELAVNWLPSWSRDDVRNTLIQQRKDNPKRTLESYCPFPLPKRLWRAILKEGAAATGWSELPKKTLENIVEDLTASKFQVLGKGQFKEEFVTCGGVPLGEVDFRTMQSRKLPGLFFAGEILDIDAITGGFNFQNAWTTAWIAGNAMAEY